MRSKKRKYTESVIATSSQLVDFAQAKEIFKNRKEINLEIGCGRGDFIINSALARPQEIFIALEKERSVLSQALRKIQERELDNLFFILGDASNLGEDLPKEKIKRIYLNFSDPWPKKRHHKRRLTASKLLVIYKAILAVDGEIAMKTDSQDLFEFTLLECQGLFTIKEISRDYPLVENAIISEYERRFREQEKPIFYLVLQSK